MTTTADRDVAKVHHSTGRGVTVLMIGAPLLMALARLMLVPMDEDDYDQNLTDAAAAQARSDTGWLLAMVASALLILTALVLAQRLAARRARLGAVVSVATTVGWVGCAGIGIGGLVLSEAGSLPDRASQVALQEGLSAGSTGFVFLMSLIGAAGYVALAVGLARSGLASRGAAVLLGVGGVTTLVTMPGPITPLLVLAALLLAAGHALVLGRLDGAPTADPR